MVIPNWLATIARIVLVVCIPIILLVSPLYLFATPAFVRYEYGLRNFPPAERFDAAERARISDTIVRYIRGWATVEELANEETDGGEIALRAEEVQHLVDVRRVMDGFFLAHVLALILTPLSLWLLWHSPRRRLLPAIIRQGLWIIGGLIVFIILAALIDFDVFFTRFHQIFFTAESWLFYLDDTLIQLYPLPLWIDATWKIGLVVLAEVSLIYGLSKWLEHSRWLTRGEA